MNGKVKDGENIHLLFFEINSKPVEILALGIKPSEYLYIEVK
tara:strand:+ start:603 stop:728 length:126 start_codon:yes stop_codon:yes gene_type:complete